MTAFDGARNLDIQIGRPRRLARARAQRTAMQLIHVMFWAAILWTVVRMVIR